MSSAKTGEHISQIYAGVTKKIRDDQNDDLTTGDCKEDRCTHTQMIGHLYNFKQKKQKKTEK